MLLFLMCTVALPGKWAGVEITAPLERCFLRTAYRTLVINSLSQDSYFWSGLLGGNLLEVNSFILRLTVLPFPAERERKSETTCFEERMEETPPKTNDDSSPLAISQTWAPGQPRCSRLRINLPKNNENSS